jgi:hypothetical protein
MKFLLTVTAFYYNTPVFYKIHQITESEFYAEPTDITMKSFKLRKQYGTWTSEGGYTHDQALQIGKEIDKAKRLNAEM